MDVPATLRAARRTRRVSQRELAALATVPRQTLERIEAGGSDPRVGTLEKLLSAIGFQLAVCNGQGRVAEDRPGPRAVGRLVRSPFPGALGSASRR